MPIDWEAEEIILTLKNAGLPNLTDEQRETLSRARDVWYSKPGGGKMARKIVKGIISESAETPVLRNIEPAMDVFTTVFAASRDIKARGGRNPLTTSGGGYSTELPKSGR